ncbi:hypothetical protein [Sphingobacterium sp. 1.A.4]|uniref:hypothetical protein n=1 Tax=Sphingobacterium sp. 1.A.4 TaxID=2044603 RepID=UPI001181916B|nr:hypothetical protein [Sphingobacterium sp. 1.A.4]
MSEIITAKITIPSSIFLAKGGLSYLQRQIDVIAEDLKEVHGYKAIEYLDHQLENGHGEVTDNESFYFVISYEVDLG